VRALLADLIAQGTITIQSRRQETIRPPAHDVLREVLQALRDPDSSSLQRKASAQREGAVHAHTAPERNTSSLVSSMPLPHA
jgi:hypothetical protein